MASIQKNTETPPKEEPTKCGIIMPISDTPGYPPGHWSDVRQIISDSIASIGLAPCLVSETNETQIIHKTIVQNLYQNEIIVCDVSSKNSNVMFELGMRLAFDKPVVIVKDDATAYSFDTSPIEHINYPKELRHPNIEEFKKELSKKIRETIEAAKKPSYSTFLKHFAIVDVAKLPMYEGTSSQLLFEKIDDLSSQIASIRRNTLINPGVKRADPTTEEIDKAKTLVRGAINHYCNIKSIEECKIYGNAEEIEKLVRFVEENSEIRRLCHQRRALQRIIEEELLPF